MAVFALHASAMADVRAAAPDSSTNTPDTAERADRAGKGFDRLYPGGYRAVRDGQTAIVDTMLAAQREPYAHTPVRLAYGLKGEVELLLARSSFILVAPDGRMLPMSDPAEVREAVDITRLDRFSQREPIRTGQHFNGSRRLDVEFFPSREEERHGDSLPLDRDSYFYTTLFFPRPEAGWGDGLYRLLIRPAGGAAPLEIPFHFLPSIYE